MRVSQKHGLIGNQATFDFVDIDPTTDTLLFIDPSALNSLDDEWSQECVTTIQDFFQTVVEAIRAGDEDRALRFLRGLREDNSTHLGHSSRSRGAGVGDKLAREFYAELASSEAIKSGLIKDLEETALMIENVGSDRISDVVTNIIRHKLAEYTETVCEFYGIDVEEGVHLRPYWNISSHGWSPLIANVPLEEEPILLVPKSIVRRSLLADAGKYYTHFVANHMVDREYEKPGSDLVTVLKNGRRKVNKTKLSERLIEQYGDRKKANTQITNSNPGILERFRETWLTEMDRPESLQRIGERVGDDTELARQYLDLSVDSALSRVRAVTPGRTESDEYEHAIQALLQILLWPDLLNPRRQVRIHNDRKRIDIAFTNSSKIGFFDWIGRRYPSAQIFCECKNYTDNIGNPEFDQLSGRFSPRRGQVGILVHRGFGDKGRVLQRCRDTADDGRGFIIALDDEDLIILVEEYKRKESCTTLDGLLYERFTALVN